MNKKTIAHIVGWILCFILVMSPILIPAILLSGWILAFKILGLTIGVLFLSTVVVILIGA